MPNIIIAPELALVKVRREGIVTVPAEMAKARCNCPGGQFCNGLSVRSLPLGLRELQVILYDMGQRFISRMKVRGYDFVGTELLLHGPWPSYEFNRVLADVEASRWAEAKRLDDPSLVLDYVHDVPEAFAEYADYLLVGDFLARPVLTEIIIGEEQ